MKTLLAVLSSLSVSVPPAGALIQSQTHSKIKNVSKENDVTLELKNLVNDNDPSIEITSAWIKSVENFLENDPSKEELLKEDFIKSISLVGEEIVINLKTMIAYKDYDFYNFLSNKDFLKILNQSFTQGIIKYENNLFSFQENISVYSGEAWTEGHWYWLAYWRVHFSHQLVQDLVAAFRKVETVASAISSITALMPGFFSKIGLVLSVVATFLWSQFERLNDADFAGRGSWFGVIAVLPFAGFGSN